MVVKRRGHDEEPPKSPLAAALAPHVERLVGEAAEREAERAAAERAAAERALVQRLDEGALMQLIFAHLDDDNPRVCNDIDFERIVVLEREAGEADAERGPELVDARGTGEPREASSEPARASTPRLDEHEWTGRGWVDDVRALDPALLDRPELDERARAVLQRARARALPCLYLRLLGRATALRHLEVFAAACRERRARYARVITGKGIESLGEPVLKRAVLGWCADEGLAYAFELDQHGEWGSLIVDLGPARAR